MAIAISIEGVEQLRRDLGVMVSPDRIRAMNTSVGKEVVERLKDHLDEMAPSRHKTADRLGAQHTRYFEFASGRVQGTQGQGTDIKSVSDDGVVVSVRNTPGLRRAFGALTITPKNGKYLTIPLHKISYARRVAELRGEGHDIFRPFGTRILAEKTGDTETYTDKNGKKRKRAKLRPLYALCKKVTVPQDAGLLPRTDEIRDWAREAAEAFILAESL